MIKKIAVVVVLFALVMSGVAYYMWNKPHPAICNEAIVVSIISDSLSVAYNRDEKGCDAKYLNKRIDVSGTISEIDKNQDGGVMLILQTSDPNSGVQCSMGKTTSEFKKGQMVTISGYCSGNSITGVSLSRCDICK